MIDAYKRGKHDGVVVGRWVHSKGIDTAETVQNKLARRASQHNKNINEQRAYTLGLFIGETPQVCKAAFRDVLWHNTTILQLPSRLTEMKHIIGNHLINRKNRR